MSGQDRKVKITLMAEREKASDTSVSAVSSAALIKSRALACEIARLADGRHCDDIVIMELAERSPVANHFVICTGTSAQQMRAVAKEIEVLGKGLGSRVYSRAGLQQGSWTIIDFFDVVVHLFEKEYRKFYDLEMLWGDAPKIDWQVE